MNIALVHDYLAQDGGAERVLKAFHEIWPDAPIFVLFQKKGAVEGFDNATIKESFLAKLPLARNKFQWFLPWMPLATERYDLTKFDVVLSSTSAFAKGVITRPDTLHISYCHTPTRYLWTDTHQYIQDLKLNRVIKALLPRLIHKLRLWDNMSVDRVDHFIANSNTVQKRIHKYYRRESDIIHPPADVDVYEPVKHKEEFFLAGGRLVSYKRFDLIIAAFNRLGWPLKIFGSGPEMDALKHVAKDNITFVGRVSDEEKVKLFQKARAFIHPQVEDLGITPIESMAAGTPVVAYGVGGVTETVIPGKTGLFFYDQSWESLYKALRTFDKQSWDVDRIRARAEKFHVDHFKEQVKKFVEDRHEVFSRGYNQCQLPL